MECICIVSFILHDFSLKYFNFYLSSDATHNATLKLSTEIGAQQNIASTSQQKVVRKRISEGYA